MKEAVPVGGRNKTSKTTEWESTGSHGVMTVTSEMCSAVPSLRPHLRKRKAPGVPDGGEEAKVRSIEKAAGGSELRTDGAEDAVVEVGEKQGGLLGGICKVDNDEIVPEPRPPLLTYSGPEEALSKSGVWEEINNYNEALLRYWADGEGALDLVTYHQGIQCKFQARREALKRLEEGNVSAVKSTADAVWSRAEEKLKKCTPPVRPTEPAFPGLWHLWPWAAVVRLPWDWACHGATEFRSKWESNVGTEAFKLELGQLLYWWTIKRKDSSLSADVRRSVSSAIDSLIESCGAQVVYPELHTMCAYLEYSKDLVTFEYSSKAYEAQLEEEARLEEEREEAVNQARLEFKRANSRLYEEVTWDWCPFWRILMSTDRLQGLELPELPWEHNCSESLRVRRALTRSRVEPVRPVPLVRVLRILFWTCYGEFRQLTCPIYGLTEHLIVKLCEDNLSLKRAISVYALEGRHLFTGLECESLETLGHRLELELEVAQIRDGRGADTLCSIMSWVRTVQLRAIQDHAAAHASQFDTAWCIQDNELWADQWEDWGQTLRTREDSDIGWLWSIGNACPPSTASADAVRADVEATLSSLTLDISEDDVLLWDTSVTSTQASSTGIGVGVVVESVSDETKDTLAESIG